MCGTIARSWTTPGMFFSFRRSHPHGSEFTPAMSLPVKTATTPGCFSAPLVWIRRIDTSGALKHPGVVAVFTGKDMAGVNSLPCGWDLRKEKNIPGVVQDLAMVPHMPLASDSARHVGDPVAVVIADSQDAALDAAELVAVDWDVKPSVTATAAAGQ